MIKKNWKVLTITSIITLLPIFAGLLLWDQLPEQIPSHWNIAGEVDGWASKPVTVFGMPLLMVVILWFGVFAMMADPKKAEQSPKVLHLVLWIIPTLSVLLHTFVYMAAMGRELDVSMIMPVFMGLLFMVIGNYLPKCKQSYTVGIKLPWTLNSDENWHKTHRLAGRLWMVCGAVMMLTSLVGGFWIFLAAVLLMVAVPVAYSYYLYRKGI